LYGYIDKTGREIVPPIYEDAQTQFTEGLAAVKLHNKYGVIDLEGNTAVPFVYDSVAFSDIRHERAPAGFSEGRMVVMTDGRYGLIDRTGAVVAPFVYDGMDGGFANGRMLVERNGKQGLIDAGGHEVLSCEYDSVEWYSFFRYIDVIENPLVKVARDEMFGAVNLDGTEVIPLVYNDVWIVSWVWRASEFDRAAVVMRYGRYGITAMDGRILIPIAFEHVNLFSGGLAAAKVNGMWGILCLEKLLNNP
jgi:hypothetical protein